MSNLRHAQQQPTHTLAMRQVFRRMLDAAGARGRFLQRPSGGQVHVVTCGQGPPVVHLHGTNTSSLSHLMVATRTPRLRSYLVDRPGCGLSDPDPYPRDRFREHAVELVGDVLDALDLQAPVLVGASGGGVWATWYALAHPERVGGLVMLGAVPTLPGSRIPVPLRLVTTPWVGAVMVRALRPGRRMLLRMMASMGEAESILQHPELLDSLVAGARDPVASQANLAELRALIARGSIRPGIGLGYPDLRRLAVPTLMIWGDHDPVVSVEEARRVAAEIPGARLEVVPAGHAPQLGQADRVAALLEEFALSRLSAE